MLLVKKFNIRGVIESELKCFQKTNVKKKYFTFMMKNYRHRDHLSSTDSNNESDPSGIVGMGGEKKKLRQTIDTNYEPKSTNESLNGTFNISDIFFCSKLYTYGCTINIFIMFV